MGDDELPRAPRKGDRLFRADLPDWMNNACLNVEHGGDDFGYKEGYRRGARLLVQQIVEDARDQDFLVYPVIFLYRHHIELALKHLLDQIPYVIGSDLTPAERKHLNKHRLDLIWLDVKPRLNCVCEAAGWAAFDPADIGGIDDYIRQLSDMDTESFAFRYTRTKKGTLSLPKDLKLINLRHFAEGIERLADCLEGLQAAVDSLAEAKAELEVQQRR